MKKTILIFVMGILLVSIVGAKEVIDDGNIGLPNPAAIYCVEQGYEYEIRDNPDGSQYGVCIFKKLECNAWAFYHGECFLPPRNNRKLCGITIIDKTISYSKNPECFCPERFDKIKIWIQDFSIAYSCQIRERINHYC